MLQIHLFVLFPMMQKGYIQKKRDGHKSTKKYSPKDEGHSLKLRAVKIRKYF